LGRVELLGQLGERRLGSRRKGSDDEARTGRKGVEPGGADGPEPSGHPVPHDRVADGLGHDEAHASGQRGRHVFGTGFGSSRTIGEQQVQHDSRSPGPDAATDDRREVRWLT
jgi:hypothetical protein